MQQMTEEQVSNFVDSRGQGTGLFHFRNEFDAVSIILDNATVSSDGPFFVLQVFEDAAIGTDNRGWEFEKLTDAVQQFNALVALEIKAVLDDGSVG